MVFEHSVVVHSYLTDSGAFKANALVQQIREYVQQICYCGTNAHYQNGVAERSIQTVSNMARAALLLQLAAQFVRHQTKKETTLCHHIPIKTSCLVVIFS